MIFFYSQQFCDLLLIYTCLYCYLHAFIGRPIKVEYSPVTDFREARCRQYEVSECNRGDYCNFIHLKRPNKGLLKQLFGSSTYGFDLFENERVEGRGFGQGRDRDDNRGRHRGGTVTCRVL